MIDIHHGPIRPFGIPAGIFSGKAGLEGGGGRRRVGGEGKMRATTADVINSAATC